MIKKTMNRLPYKSSGTALETLDRGNAVYVETAYGFILRYIGHWKGLESFCADIRAGRVYSAKQSGPNKGRE